MNLRGNTTISIIALVIAIAALIISISTWIKVNQPNPNVLRLAEAVDRLAQATSEMENRND